ncbi:hypothetical protein TBLA_0H00590 [Henningerozyma blattae CBS 6284]|uniref:Protein CCC1 n=1 Tax=Henningerozyma blattae (strain ATCC 34711 / CBS 6284 / DSM 70876 / NBRC 10599 / NRRL Y-10934 / UCD 77-7) TaxID=1071380 RepID=I2H7J8_HENB6|nr:hypothetical protein TBLA_0H00590 [Tetrapisispora blattae CBS 6284]CCH62350.1 hypothetical protein TBLA_0H00590 [Tetrapisispora blattae CBS 6284]
MTSSLLTNANKTQGYESIAQELGNQDDQHICMPPQGTINESVNTDLDRNEFIAPNDNDFFSPNGGNPMGGQSLLFRVFGKMDPRVISDLIIGLSDGLTVPFALTAGLSSLGDSRLVIAGGFAELISGAISMGLGGYLGAKSEADYYHAEVGHQKAGFREDQTSVNHEVEDILLEMNPEFSPETIVSFVRDLKEHPELMVNFVIRFGKGLEEPAENRQLISALTIGGGYLAGGLIPLLPYFFVAHVGTGLVYSVIVMIITLFWFGYIKTALAMGDDCSVQKKTLEGLQMIAVGGTAAGAAWYAVKLLA